MPLPLIVPFVAIAASSFVGTAGVVTAAEKNSEARDVQKTAEEILANARNDMEYYRVSTKKYFEKLGESKIKVCTNELHSFVESFSKLKGVNFLESSGIDELEKVKMNSKDIAEMKEITTQATQMMGGGVASVGAGALIGWGVYGGVSTFAMSGTGVTIGTLHGIAASNATLAWIGGGSLTAGGLGVAGGTAILGGLIAAPALALIAGFAGVAASKNLDNAYANKAEAEKISEQVYTSGKTLHHFCEIAVIIKKNIERLGLRLNKANLKLAEIVSEKSEWQDLNEDEKYMVAIAAKYAMTIKKLVDMPLLTENGLLSNEANLLYDEYAHNAKRVYKAEGQNQIDAQEVIRWKDENVNSPNEYMCIIDPLVNMSFLKNILLPDCSPDKYLIFASVDRETEDVVCYAVVDRKAVDLNNVQEIFKNNRRN